MVYHLYSSYAASISDLKKNPTQTVASGHGEAVAILNRNEPVFYCVPANTYAKICDLLEDADLRMLIEARAHEKEVEVSLDDL